MDNKIDIIDAEGTIVEILPHAMFKILLDNGHTIIGQASGKMRLHHIKILLKDRVRVEISQYDLTRGRIVYRSK